MTRYRWLKCLTCEKENEERFFMTEDECDDYFKIRNNLTPIKDSDTLPK